MHAVLYCGYGKLKVGERVCGRSVLSEDRQGLVSHISLSFSLFFSVCNYRRRRDERGKSATKSFPPKTIQKQKEQRDVCMCIINLYLCRQ